MPWGCFWYSDSVGVSDDVPYFLMCDTYSYFPSCLLLSPPQHPLAVCIAASVPQTTYNNVVTYLNLLGVFSAAGSWCCLTIVVVRWPGQCEQEADRLTELSTAGFLP